MYRSELIKLKPEIKERWLKALRSGDYKQGQGQLRKNDKYCCLGVLCDIVKEELGINVTREHNEFTYSYSFLYNDQEELLPNEVVKECSTNFSPTSHNNENISVYYDGMLKDLSGLNDVEGLDFIQIADLIEAQL